MSDYLTIFYQVVSQCLHQKQPSIDFKYVLYTIGMHVCESQIKLWEIKAYPIPSVVLNGVGVMTFFLLKINNVSHVLSIDHIY